MGSIGWPLQWAALLTQPVTQRGETIQSSQSRCATFHALSRKSSTPRFRLYLTLISRVSVKSVWLGDTRRLSYEGNRLIHHPVRPNHSSNSFLADLYSCHEVELCTKAQPPAKGYQALLALPPPPPPHFSQVDPKPPSKVSWLLISTDKSSRKRWW